MFAQLKVYGALIIGAAWVATVAAAFFYGVGTGEDKSSAREAREDALARYVADVANTVAATAIAGIEIKHTTIRQEVQREIIKEPVYRECRHSTDGLRGINDALRAGDIPAGRGVVPRADTAQ